MLRWFGRLVRDEMRSFGTIAFFLVVAMSIGSAASWFEGGSSHYLASHTAQAATVPEVGYVSQEATSTAEAYLPPSMSTTTR